MAQRFGSSVEKLQTWFPAMKLNFSFAFCFLLFAFCKAQQPLPPKTFYTMRDSTTSMDIVMMQGKGGSLSLDGRNVKLFNSFFENKSAAKIKAPLAGTIMWQKNGREFISGNYFLGDSTGCVILPKTVKNM